jgi:hypothetical protein
MPEPTTSAGAAGVAIASSASAAAIGGGIGAAIIMCLRLPKTRIEMFLQVLVAFGFSIPLAPVVVRSLDKFAESFSVSDYSAFEYDMLIGLTAAILASVSWGLLSIILNFRDRAVRRPRESGEDFLSALRALRSSGELSDKTEPRRPARQFVEREGDDASR